MEPLVLLSQLKALVARAPDFNAYSATSQEYHAWLGQAHALATRWQPMEANSISSAATYLNSSLMRDIGIAQVFGVLHRAIADLELQLPAQSDQSFGPGAIYDFYRALNQIISSAQHTLLIADLYMDDTVFDAYLSALPKGVSVRLLAERYTAKLKPASQRFVAQYGTQIEIRSSNAFHDRVVFVDDAVGWVIGQSIKDAAASKPTYIAPLSPDVASSKLANYETVWSNSAQI